MSRAFDRVIGVAAGLVGAAGVVLSAVGAHAAPGTNLDTAGTTLLVHGAALLALAAPSVGSAAVRRLAGLVLFAGVCLFAGDLSMRAFQGHALFPLAAPTGGMAMIGGWLLAGLAYLGPGPARHH